MTGDDQMDLFPGHPAPGRKSYYNTTRSAGADLADYEEQARDQEAEVLRFFLQGGRYAPSEVHEQVLPEAPLTSCRRAITNLTKRGLLRKTTDQRTGPFGRPEYLWEACGA